MSVPLAAGCGHMNKSTINNFMKRRVTAMPGVGIVPSVSYENTPPVLHSDGVI